MSKHAVVVYFIFYSYNLTTSWIGPDGTPDLEHLDNELLKYSEENVPMIGSFSAGSNVTGIRAPVRSICKLLHKYGAYAFFDYASVEA